MQTIRICYVILLHHKFDQALRLLRRLAGPRTGFVVHIDSAANAAQAAVFRRDIESLGPIVYVDAVRSRWGSFNQALAIARCVQTANDQMDGFDRYILLSGQDYPIAENASIMSYLAANSDREFIEATRLDLADAAAPGWTPYYRFRRYHFWIGSRRIKVPFLRKSVPPIEIFHGSTWWALTRSAIVYVADQSRRHQAFNSYLSSGFLVDEVYVPSLLMDSPFASAITGQNLTFARWTPASGPHPKLLTLDDLGELKASGKLFARKFDASVDMSVLDRLDAMHSQVRTGSPVLKI